MAKHSYDPIATPACQCKRCVKERVRRAVQADGNAKERALLQAIAPRNRRLRAYLRGGERRASRSVQHARYIDSGPGAWDDRD